MHLKVFIESLGCSKNLVDSEVMIGLLSQYDFEIIKDQYEADIIIVNTCGFIEAAKQESIDTIVELGTLKTNGNCKLLVVAGCLAERYAKELAEELPEVDAIIGTGNYPEIIKVIHDTLKGERVVKHGNINMEISEDLPRTLSTPEFMGYLKIAEGCDNYCTYCIIPKLRGNYRSRKMEYIIKEAEEMAKKGVKELILIAQDTSRYGIDLYKAYKLPELLKSLAQIDGIKWIRILYCYPDKISDELIKVMAEESKICKYIDVPIQHCNNEILKRMNRKTSKEHILHVMNKLRHKMPDIHIRTSLIVGFPGETKEQFEELKTFVKDVKFDRLGVFTYSQEEDTPAAKLKDQISEEIKEQRRASIMAIQKEISLQKNMEKIGNIYDILIEEKIDEEDVYVGRTMYDAPEVDGIVYVNSTKPLSIGDLVKVKITDTLEYDLLGEILYESCE
ncbi:30S ribosomal protein S12 methylthiotransferase RimO [Crassaminicella indica]|uniref:Ribosomal protein uS12 methylthiotransferase RimO n=1 Tax=Crassaminicella indica TaxID=2855394 RepID=A0ABX8RAK3_9CLOT|nr:30S ribosomal protein S12 methylthiotransferase RimO [Crassaminicella indica]QXM06089.1 30S ribosomal protein S12 methylthiotransferase RimO [Crassaminicella indica]